MSRTTGRTVHLADSLCTAISDELSTLLANEEQRVRQSRFDIVRNWEMRRRGVQRALHDGAQQQLLGLRLSLLGDTPRVNESLRLTEIIADIQQLAVGLPPSAMNTADIVSGLRQMADQSGLVVRLHTPMAVSLSVVVAEVVAFTTSEALANTLRHAPGAACSISLTVAERVVDLEVTDDGPGGALMTASGGLTGLARRAEELGGTLTVRSSAEGTSVHLVVTDSPQWLPPHEPGGQSGPSWTAETRDHLRLLTGDPALCLWFEVGQSTLLDEHGSTYSPAPGQSMQIVELLHDGALIAVLHTSIGERLEQCCNDPAVDLGQGHARATSAAFLVSLGNARDHIARRAAAFEASLAKRLTDTPLQLLREAGEEITVQHRQNAANLTLEATNSLRRIIRVLGSATAAVTGDEPTADPYLFGLLAEHAHVSIDVKVRDVPTEPARTAIARIGEELVSDAQPGDHIKVRVAAGVRHVVAAFTLHRLPGPAALAFVEDTALLIGGSLQCRPTGAEVRVRVELPI